MKRFVSACLLCSVGLGLGVTIFSPPAWLAHFITASAAPAAKEQLIKSLLALPAPPPPNPLDPPLSERDDRFYAAANPPPDNATIDDLIDYWTHWNGQYNNGWSWLPKPSNRTVERLLEEGKKDASTLSGVLNVLPNDSGTAEAVKAIYDKTPKSDAGAQELKNWLRHNSLYFEDSLQSVAEHARDNSSSYVDLPVERDVLALTGLDWERAQPDVQRMYSDQSQPVTRALATWALYKHALESGDLGDIDRYRSELMKMVENKDLPDGVRDKANDALTHEADFAGRADWTFSLFKDPTLVNMPQYTMLTTLFTYSPADQYTDRLIELFRSDDPLVRAMAARCLITTFDRSQDPEIIRALLPWLENPKLVVPGRDDGGRQQIIAYLESHKMPESVPGLIVVLDERGPSPYGSVPIDGVDSSANSENSAESFSVGSNSIYSNRASALSTAEAVDAARHSMTNVNAGAANRNEVFYPLRSEAVQALAFQADPSAVPALRRTLLQTRSADPYQRMMLMGAILKCGGYPVGEQVDALEYFAKKGPATDDESAVISGYANSYNAMSRAISTTDDRMNLGQLVAETTDVSDELARAAVERISTVQTRDPQTALALRRIVVNWKGIAVSALLLSDLKVDRAEPVAVVRLLAERGMLRERLPDDVRSAGSGTATATGISACILDDPHSYETVLDGQNVDAKIALLACGRLIRAVLPIMKVAAYLKSSDPTLKAAAELYLESEDSPEARSIVLGLHPNEAKIMGAGSYFKGRNNGDGAGFDLLDLFASVNPSSVFSLDGEAEYPQGDLEKSEKRLQTEMKGSSDLLGLYAYDDNFIRIYQNRAVFSWEDDPSRYHERVLSNEEFEHFKTLLASHHIEQLKPFLSCRDERCVEPKELLVLSRNGGSRVFLRSSRMPQFFADLETIFSSFRSQPAAMKYSLSRSVAGLELLFANDELDAQTVWKQGNDLRFVVTNKAIRQKVEDEVAEIDDRDANTQEVPDIPERRSVAERLQAKRQFEGIAWHKFEAGRMGEEIAQPAGIEYIIPGDGLEPPAGQEQWKARVNGVEFRANDSGLFKLSSGHVTKIHDGQYDNPVVSTNGKWLVVTKFIEDAGPSISRIDLATNREFRVEASVYGMLVPKAYIAATGKFLLAVEREDGDFEGDADEEGSDEGDAPDTVVSPPSYYLLNPETGVLTVVPGEASPLADQTFRPLQPASKVGEFWAAIPDTRRNETRIGTYDPKLFRLRTVMTLPKIAFNSMDMWVDEADSKLYFVYNGQMLSLPMRSAPPK